MADTDAPAFASLPWRELLADPRLVDRPLDEQAAYFRLLLAAWGAGGFLPAEVTRVALRAQVALAPLSTLTLERFTVFLDALAPIGGNGLRSLGASFEGWLKKAVDGSQAKKVSLAKARAAKAAKNRGGTDTDSGTGSVSGTDIGADSGPETDADTDSDTGSVSGDSSVAGSVTSPVPPPPPPPSPSPLPTTSVANATGAKPRAVDAADPRPARQQDPVSDGQLIQYERIVLWAPDRKPPGDWTEGRSFTVYRELREKYGYSGSRIMLALEGLEVLRRTGEVDWIGKGSKVTVLALYNSGVGVVSSFEFAEAAAVRESERRGRTRQPIPFAKILAAGAAKERTS